MHAFGAPPGREEGWASAKLVFLSSVSRSYSHRSNRSCAGRHRLWDTECLVLAGRAWRLSVHGAVSILCCGTPRAHKLVPCALYPPYFLRHAGCFCHRCGRGLAVVAPVRKAAADFWRWACDVFFSAHFVVIVAVLLLHPAVRSSPRGAADGTDGPAPAQLPCRERDTRSVCSPFRTETLTRFHRFRQRLC